MTVISASSPAVQQLIAFLEALAMGAFFAAVYDLYRSLRMQFRRLPAALSVTADCLFWIAAAAATILFLVYRRWGEIYAYTYCGLAGGFIIYFYFFSSFLLPLWQKGFGFLFRPWQCRNKAAGGTGEGIEDKEKRFFRKCRIFRFIRRK